MASAAISTTGESLPVFYEQRDTVGTSAFFAGPVLNVSALVTVLDVSAIVPTDGVTYAEIGDVVMPGLVPGARLVVVWNAANSRLRVLNASPNVLTTTGTTVSYQDHGSVELLWSGTNWFLL